MKIGILTFHYSINPGSVMQAYCVYKLLKNSFPEAKVEIINLVPANREKNERNFLLTKPPFIRPYKMIRYISIRNFIKKNTELSPLSSETGLSAQIDFINSLNYDYIFTGSDTVWMHSGKLDKLLPNIYFLPPQINAQKAAIAASVDPLLRENEYLDKKEMIHSVLKQYKMLLVRDTVTADLLKDIGVEHVQKIADPTLLYDFETGLGIKTNKSMNVQKKTVLIGVTDMNIAKWIEKTLKGHSDQYEFINIKKSVGLFADQVIDHLNLYGQIDILITDRFHGSLFAMKLSNALVINVERFNKNPVPKSKGRDLFLSIGIPEYCIRLEKDNQEEFKNKMLELIDGWTPQQFLHREKLVREFMNQNQATWQYHLSNALPGKKSAIPV